MKKFVLAALFTTFAAVLNAQGFRSITDIDDDRRGFELSFVGFLNDAEKRFGGQIAYEINPLTAYFEATAYSGILSKKYNNLEYKAPSFRLGMDYGFLELGVLTVFTGAYVGITAYSTEYKERDNNIYVPSEWLVKVHENGFIVGLKIGAKLSLGEHVFVKAAFFTNTTNWNRSIGKYVAKDAIGAGTSGLNIAFGVRF